MADHEVERASTTDHDIGRLPVMSRAAPSRMVGIITRADLLRAHRRRLDETQKPGRTIDVKTIAGAWRRGRDAQRIS